MKTVLKSLWKRKLTTLLLVAEISISILYFIIVVCEIQQAFRFNIIMPKQVSCNTEQLLEVNVGEDLTGEKYREIKKMLLDTGMVERVAVIDNDWDCDSEFSDEDIPSLRITEDALCIKDFPVKAGRKLNEDDFRKSGKKKSVLVGSELAENRNYKVGDKIVSFDTEETYEIVGILQEGTSCFVQSFADGTLQDLDNGMICPTYEEKMESINGIRFYCVLSDEKYKNDVENVIAGSRNITGVRLEATAVSDILENAFLEKYNSIKSWLVVSLVIVLLSAIGVATIISSMTYTRKQEIGVRVSVGYSMGQIKQLFIRESVFVACFAYMLSAILSILLVGTGDSGEIYAVGSYISGQALAYGAVIALIYAILPTLVILYQFRNVSPRDLIGGRE